MRLLGIGLVCSFWFYFLLNTNFYSVHGHTLSTPPNPKTVLMRVRGPPSPFLRPEKPCLHVLRSAIMSFLIVLFILNLSTIDESNLFEVDFAQWKFDFCLAFCLWVKIYVCKYNLIVCIVSLMRDILKREQGL